MSTQIRDLYKGVTAATVAAANALIAGERQKMIITVTADENNGGAKTYYRYEGSAGVLIADFDKFSSTYFDTIGGETVIKDSKINSLIAAYLSANGYTAGGGGNTTPAAPTIIADDTDNTIDATHTLGDSEIMISVNDGTYTQFDGTPISVGDVARATGYYKFKIKAATGRNESSVASSPAFTVAGGGVNTTELILDNPTPEAGGNFTEISPGYWSTNGVGIMWPVNVASSQKIQYLNDLITSISNGDATVFGLSTSPTPEEWPNYRYAAFNTNSDYTVRDNGNGINIGRAPLNGDRRKLVRDTDGFMKFYVKSTGDADWVLLHTSSAQVTAALTMQMTPVSSHGIVNPKYILG